MRKRMWIVAVSAVALALAVAMPVAAAGGLDQHQDGFADGVMTPGGAVGMGQTFTAGATGNLDQIAIYVGVGPARPKVAAPARIGGIPQAPGDNIVVQIRSTTGGTPDFSGDPLREVTAQARALNLEWLIVPITPAVPVQIHHVYALAVWPMSQEASLGWGGNCGGNPYAGGSPFAFTATTVGPLNSNGIETCVNDLAFRTYVTRGATPPPTGTPSPKAPVPSSSLALIFATFALGAAFVTVRKAAEARRRF